MFQKFSNLLEENNEKILNEIKSNKLKLKSVGRLRKEKEKLKKEKRFGNKGFEGSFG